MEVEKFEQVALRLGDLLVDTMFENHVFIVGGAVRDYLLGRPINDIDLVVDLPFGGIGFAEWVTREMKVYKKDSNPLVYGQFGTAMFRLWDQEFEVVMSRSEAYTEGSRKPEVRFGTIEQDAFRRDFTVNSLMLNISNGAISDLTGEGIKALSTGVLRTTSDPESIFKEDPLRMLRAARFAGQLTNEKEGIKMFQIGTKEVAAMKSNRAKLSDISKERIQSELVKILKSKSPLVGIDILVKTGLMDFIIPNMSRMVGRTQNKHHVADVYGHTMMALTHTVPVLEQRLAVLLHDIGKPATAFQKPDGEFSFHGHETMGADMTEAILKDLKFPTATIVKVKKLVKMHMLTKTWGEQAEKVSKKSLRKFVAKAGEDLNDLLGVIHADNMAHAPASCMPEQVHFIEVMIAELKQRKEPTIMPVNGQDIMFNFDVKQGKEVGELLAIAQEIFFENPLLTNSELIELVKEQR